MGERLPLPPVTDASPFTIEDARPARFGARAATRYTLRVPRRYTGDEAVDRALATVPAYVLVPPGVPAAEAPVVTLLQGITAPLDRSGPLVGPLLDAGFGCVLFDTPLGGSRLAGGPRGSDLPLLARAGPLDVAFAARLFDGVADDMDAALAVAAREHGLAQAMEENGRLALFGVSFGGLLSSHAFLRRGRGRRLLIAAGHPDLPAMARGLARSFARGAGLPEPIVSALLRGAPLGPLASLATARLGGEAAGVVALATLLVRLGRDGRAVRDLNPLAAADRADRRPVRLLTGDADPVATPADTRAAATHFADGTAVVLPGLHHGWRPHGPGSFTDDCLVFLRRELGDWWEV